MHLNSSKPPAAGWWLNIYEGAGAAAHVAYELITIMARAKKISAGQEVMAAAAKIVADFGAHKTDAYFSGFSPEATFMFYTLVTQSLLRRKDKYF